MGYLFQGLPADLLTAEPPQLSLIEPQAIGERRLTTVFLSTMLAVPEFRARVLQLVGARGGGGSAEVFARVRFRGQAGDLERFLADGLVRTRGPAAFSALVATKGQAFAAENGDQITRLAKALNLARERKIQRVIAIANLAPDQAVIEALKNHPLGPPVDRLRSLTWMETLDIALHLLDRKVVRRPVGMFLLEQYVRFVKEEAVRDLQARSSRPAGSIFFASLGRDWPQLIADLRRGHVDNRDPRLATIATNWLSFLRFLSLYMTRGGLRDEDALNFPNVRGASLAQRKELVARRLNADGKLLATFKKHDEAASLVLGVDVKQPQVTLQIELDGPSGKEPGGNRIHHLAESVRDDRTFGTTRLKIFWPREKTPRIVTREQALKDPIVTAPPQHDMFPERFVVERTVPCEAVIGDAETFVQFVMLELRGFRASVRHALLRGLPGG